MDQLTVKRGNPNFGKAKNEVTTEVTTSKKPKKGYYLFKLVESYEKLKPVDNVTGQIVDNPYPALYYVPNSGVAFNEKTGEIDRWRYLHGYASIWESEQQNPVPSTQRLNNVDGKNDLVLRQGFLKIKANEEAKMKALMIQDIYADNENKLNEVKPVYTLIDEDKVRLQVRMDADKAFEAESAARTATIAEMLPVAMILGIDVQYGADDEENIRTQFILRAKNNPTGFLKVFADPRNKIKYLVTLALNKGIISSFEDKLSMTDTGVFVVGIKSDGDVAEQVATLAMSGNKAAKDLYENLKNMDL